MGSRANEAVRRRLTEAFERLGLRVAEHGDREVISPATLVKPRSVVARLPGREPGRKAILLTAHHDSVGAGPGASDDGAGVAAIVETARALTAGKPLRRTVILAITDGEELGLLGARALARQTSLVEEVDAVINLEARGTAGPSLLFETGADNEAWIDLFARTARHPLASSFFYSVYERMPNDTDFTVFKRAGLGGYNLAFIRGGAWYHTSRDALEHVDVASLQHHGENALALARALADLDASPVSQGDAGYFDVLGFWLVRWPLAATLPLAALAVMLLLAAVWLTRSSAEPFPGRAVRGMVAGTIVAVFTSMVGYGTTLLLVPLPGWIRLPPAMVVVGWVLALSGALAVAHGGGERLSSVQAWIGGWIGAALAGMGLASVWPGTAYVLVLPALVAGAIAIIVAALRPGQGTRSVGTVMVSIPLATLLVAVLPIEFGMRDALGPVSFGPPALVAAATVPALAALSSRLRRTLLLAAIPCMAVAVAWVVLSPSYDFWRPERVNVVLRHDFTRGESTWFAERLDHHGPRTAFLRAEPQRATPWDRTPRYIPIPDEVLAGAEFNAPGLRVLEVRAAGKATHLQLAIQAPPETERLVIALPSRLSYTDTAVHVDGRTFQLPFLEVRADWRIITLLPPPTGRFEFELTALPPGPEAAPVPQVQVCLAAWSTGFMDRSAQTVMDRLRDSTRSTGRAGDRTVVLSSFAIQLR